MNGKPVAMADLIFHDGQPFRHSNPNGPANPVWPSALPLLTNRIASGAAEKYDFLLRSGKYLMTFEFLTWVHPDGSAPPKP
ncbi:hypothetical protein [Arthrobacter crystallopoietes]|uniref:hypothetical protein n=1 Tax=Crystallibacter crystallopoietes TaxID=37928 RepID=UPI001485FF84|nr:hypothetical protein [Arthrobacter crystallopoietes]